MQNQELDFSKFNEKFSNKYEIEGPEFSELDERRERYIQENALKYEYDSGIPANIPGMKLLPKRGLPSTRWFYRPCTSLELNGYFNIATPRNALRLSNYFFFFFIIWGFSQFQITSLYNELHNDNFEPQGRIYDKISNRPGPYRKPFTRPG